MKTLLHSIGFYITGFVMLFTATMVITSIYAILTWDFQAWSNVIEWLKPSHNLLVRIVSFLGMPLAIIGGKIYEELHG